MRNLALIAVIVLLAAIALGRVDLRFAESTTQTETAVNWHCWALGPSPSTDAAATHNVNAIHRSTAQGYARANFRRVLSVTDAQLDEYAVDCAPPVLQYLDNRYARAASSTPREADPVPDPAPEPPAPVAPEPTARPTPTWDCEITAVKRYGVGRHAYEDTSQQTHSDIEASTAAAAAEIAVAGWRERTSSRGTIVSVEATCRRG